MAAHGAGAAAGEKRSIGILGSSLNNPIFAGPYASFLDELHKLGFRRDQNLGIEYRPIDQPSTEAGGLLSYGADFKAMFRQCASYVVKILQGAKPSDLPVEQPTKFEMVLNLRTPKAIGVEIPPSILLRADEVIE